MNVSGEFTVKAPRDGGFDTIRDPVLLFAGRWRARSEGDRPDPYEAVFETKVAYMKFSSTSRSR